MNKFEFVFDEEALELPVGVVDAYEEACEEASSSTNEEFNNLFN